MTLSYPYPSILQVNLSALKRNYNILSQSVENAEIALVLKANAYGLGALEIGNFLKAHINIKTIFVAYCCEAITLRKIFPKADIYVLHGSLLGEKETFLKYYLRPVLNTKEQLEEWQEEIMGEGHYPFALQFDTGMSRFGFSRASFEEIKTLNLKPSLVMSHLACADDAEHPLNEQQYQNFLYFSSFFPNAKKSLAASSGFFLGKKYHFDIVRPGAALYGVNPYKNKENPLENILELSASLQQSHVIMKGDGVGYGHDWVACRETCVGTFNIGYADGISRKFSKEGHLFYKGKKLPIIGRISMDSLSVDITKLKDNMPKMGKFFKIIYEQQDINKIASLLETIPYEILTSFGKRSHKIYIQDGL